MKHSLRRDLCILLASALVLCLLTSCGGKGQKTVQTEAAVGESLSTMFFDFTVNTAQRVASYEDYAPQQPEPALVLLNITVTNTAQKAVTMYDSDFTLAYGDGAQDFAWIYDAFTDAMQPAEETINAGESRTYDLLFPVPQDKTDFVLRYTETYKEDAGEQTTGETFRVTFHA
ncbi:MAG: DUF4352 domain-containing protein [Ruthenibacterium sp.]